MLLDQPIVLATAHNAMIAPALLLATLVVATCRVGSGLREWQPFVSTNLA